MMPHKELCSEVDPDVIIDDGDFGDFESGTFSLRVYLKKRNRYMKTVI